MVNFCVFLCYPLARQENPLEIFPYGDPLPLPTGKLGKLPPLPAGKSDPFRGGGGGGLWIFSGTTQSLIIIAILMIRMGVHISKQGD